MPLFTWFHVKPTRTDAHTMSECWSSQHWEQGLPSDSLAEEKTKDSPPGKGPRNLIQLTGANPRWAPASRPPDESERTSPSINSLLVSREIRPGIPGHHHHDTFESPSACTQGGSVPWCGVAAGGLLSCWLWVRSPCGPSSQPSTESSKGHHHDDRSSHCRPCWSP